MTKALFQTPPDIGKLLYSPEHTHITNNNIVLFPLRNTVSASSVPADVSSAEHEELVSQASSSQEVSQAVSSPSDPITSEWLFNYGADVYLRDFVRLNCSSFPKREPTQLKDLVDFYAHFAETAPSWSPVVARAYWRTLENPLYSWILHEDLLREFAAHATLSWPAVFALAAYHMPWPVVYARLYHVGDPRAALISALTKLYRTLSHFVGLSSRRQKVLDQMLSVMRKAQTLVSLRQVLSYCTRLSYNLNKECERYKQVVASWYIAQIVLHGSLPQHYNLQEVQELLFNIRKLQMKYAVTWRITQRLGAKIRLFWEAFDSKWKG